MSIISATALSELTWQQHLQQAITDPAELLTLLELDHQQYLAPAINASKLFPLKVPRTLLNRIKKNTILDPILQQVLPLGDELVSTVGYSSDPVGEQGNPTTGLIHKYAGRVLLLVNGHCAVNCRYCFRREFPYEENRLNRTQWQAVLDELASDTSIHEVIYSGGDPLASNDKQLQWLTEQIAAIPHIKRLRIHTRLPVVIPNRITQDCLAWMANHRLSTVVVLHINHANELNDKTLRESINAMRTAGIQVLNQAVLLKGVNDTVDVLAELSETLFASGVLPYYLHVLDKVNGSAHFAISDNSARGLHQALTERLSGYLVPKLVREIPEQRSKTAL